MSEQQNAYLKAMGIAVWKERFPTNRSISIQNEAKEQRIKLVEETPVAKSKQSVEMLDWRELQSTVAECHICALSKTRNKTIFGSGDKKASLFILGAAPNKEDENQSTPYTGESGQLLTAMINAMGYQRNDVYISNLVKCKTLENKEPTIEEVEACKPYLIRQIKLLEPDLILVLGVVAAQRILKIKSSLARLRGHIHYIDDIKIPIIVTFEPTDLLRSQNEKEKAWNDLKLAMKELIK